ncbi:PAN domain-containing protein [Apiospora rasikravindrae]|uniref:PAN domain-containing protein n=1 Tax=Apiospora rasikravindrae TaxID=990691 RepID=A0ABR1RXX5_9PEZI
MGSKKPKSETHSAKTSPTTPTAPDSAAVTTPSTASTAVPCPHSDGTVPVCWDCIEAGHPGGTKKNNTTGAAALVSPLSDKKRKRSKASIFSKLSGTGSTHSALQVHPPEPGKEVIVADYQHLSQPGLEVLAGPRTVDPRSKAYYKNKNKTNERTDAENWDAESTTVQSKSKEDRILGMRKKRFWLSALLIGLLVVVITVGVVVGMQQSGKFTKNTGMQSNGESGTTPTSGSPSATPSASSPSGGIGPITCPSANNSTYTLPDNSNIKFKIGCGLSRDGGDLQSVTAATFLQCMEECAKRTGCAGVSWINDGDAGSANNYCYTKLAMDGKTRNNPFAQSAELVTGS